MIRTSAIWLLVFVLSCLAWRRWFFPLCIAVLLMSVYAHPDFPEMVGGIQGLNPWNILLLNVFLAWIINRSQEGLIWDMPNHIRISLFVYIFLVVISSFRSIIDSHNNESTMSLMSDYIVNSIKFSLPCIILYDTCRSRKMVHYALIAVLGLYVLLAVQVVRWMPVNYAFSGDALRARSAKILVNEIGYHRVSMSMLLAGSSWAMVSLIPLVQTTARRLGLVGATGLIVFAQTLTAGRAGYITWVILGLIMSILRWRRLVILIPVAVFSVTTLLPGVEEGMLQGIGRSQQDVIIVQQDDPENYEATSGRTLIWPYVINKIYESPMIGYGRSAMVRTGITEFISRDVLGLADNESDFSHPHNAYLQCLLDNGIIGFLGIMGFFCIVLWHALRLFLDRSDPLYCAAGGTALALVLSLLIASMSGQTFYPVDDAVGMWAAIGIMLRVSYERTQSKAAGRKLFSRGATERSSEFSRQRFQQKAPLWQNLRTS